MRLPGGDAQRLADRLHALDYTVEGVRRLLGEVAAEAIDREEPVPARRRLAADRSDLATVVRVFLLAERASGAEVAAALGSDLHQLGDLLRRSGDGVEAAVELAPYASDEHNWWVASDWSARRTGRPTAGDHVLGVGGASTMLAQCTVRPEVDRALDLGTGCGVQAFHLAGHATSVVATDVSERCLQLARFNAALNGMAIDFRLGSLFDPVESETFDLIVSNPPFVIGSPESARHDYRDSGFDGDGVCAAIVSGASTRLRDGGVMQLLANWEITDGDDWAARPRTWVGSGGLDAWVIQRDVQDPASYVEMWLRDAGYVGSPEYPALYDRWLTTLEERGVLGVGFGLVSLRRSGRDQPVQRFEHVPQPWQQPVAPDVEHWLDVQERVGRSPADLLLLPLSVAPDVVVEHHASARGERLLSVLRRTSGMAWSGPVDDVGLAVLAGLDGVRGAGEVVVDVAEQGGHDVAEALAASVPVLKRLADEGFVRLPEGVAGSPAVPPGAGS